MIPALDHTPQLSVHVSRAGESMELNIYSAQFARALFAVYPWLEEHARTNPHADIEPGTLLVEFSPAPKREACDLWISADNREVTIGFGMFHSHFDWPAPEGHEYWENPLDFLENLIQDRILIQDWTKSGMWSGSSTLQPGESPDLSKLEADNVVQIRSWSGRFDRTISKDVAG